VGFPSLELHDNYVCDGCGMDPIQGKRYHCRECTDFDLCEDCSIRTTHPHNLVDMCSESKLKKSIAMDRQTQRSKLMNSCRLSINRLSNV
jgi:hypothetical protein